MIKEVLQKLENTQGFSGRNIWNRETSWVAFKVFLALLPSVLLWYFWIFTAVNVYLYPTDNKADIWAIHPSIHFAILFVLVALTFLIARFSDKAQNSPKLGLVAISLVGCGAIVVVSPTGYAWIGLGLLAIATLYYWLTPWKAISAQWKPLSKRPEKTQAVIMHLVINSIAVPYPKIRQALLPLLAELLELADESHQRKQTDFINYDEFIQDISEYLKPVLGALSYRANQSAQDASTLLKFMERYPPFEVAERTQYNSVEYYRNAVLGNEGSEDFTKIMWLKSGLMVADSSPNTLADTLFDIELMLIPLLLKSESPNQREIKDLLIRLMIRLEKAENTFNVFQQNSWINVLETLREVSDEHEDIVRKWCGFDYQWPAHRDSFSEGSYAYSEEREARLERVAKSLWARIDGSDTGPSLIGIKSDLWKMGLFDEEEISSEKSIQNDEQTHQDLPDRVANILMEGERFTLYEFIKTFPESKMGLFLNLLSNEVREAFYQSITEQFEFDAKSRYDVIRNYVGQEEISKAQEGSQKAFMNLVFRYIKAGQHYAMWVLRQIDEYDATNYCNETDRYEYDIENKLNQAVMRRPDQSADLVEAILEELKSDIETQQLDLQDFIDHLGYKFGALVYSYNTVFSKPVFEWFLSSAQNQSNILETEQVSTDYFLRFMLNVMDFQMKAKQGDKSGMFNALHQLLILSSVRYPLHKQTTEAGLVSLLQMLAISGQSSEDIQSFFETLKTIPNDYPNLTPENQDELQVIIRSAIVQYDLLDAEQLNTQQKSILSQFLVGVEAF